MSALPPSCRLFNDAVSNLAAAFTSVREFSVFVLFRFFSIQRAKIITSLSAFLFLLRYRGSGKPFPSISRSVLGSLLEHSRDPLLAGRHVFPQYMSECYPRVDIAQHWMLHSNCTGVSAALGRCT